MKKSAKALSILLAFVLILGVMIVAPVGASALDNGTFTYTEDNGQITVTKATRIIDTTAKSKTKYFYTVRVLSADRKKSISGYNTTGRAIIR